MFVVSIGISKYKNDTLRELPGCSNDPELLVEAFEHLASTLGRTVNSLVLKDADATYASIETSVKTWVDQACSSTVPEQFVFHFSGHGAQARPRGLVAKIPYWQTILAHDSRCDRTGDIREDRWTVWLAPLVQRGHRVLVILDTCYAGRSPASLNTSLKQVTANHRVRHVRSRAWKRAKREAREYRAVAKRFPIASIRACDFHGSTRALSEVCYLPAGARDQGVLTHLVASALQSGHIDRQTSVASLVRSIELVAAREKLPNLVQFEDPYAGALFTS